MVAGGAVERQRDGAEESPERGAQRGATGRAGTGHPPPTDRREVANERSEEREERGRAVTAVLRGVLERGIGVNRS